MYAPRGGSNGQNLMTWAGDWSASGLVVEFWSADEEPAPGRLCAPDRVSGFVMSALHSEGNLGNMRERSAPLGVAGHEWAQAIDKLGAPQIRHSDPD